MLNTSLDVYETSKAPAISHLKANSQQLFKGQETLKALVDEKAVTKPLISEEMLSKAVKVLNEHVAPAMQSVQFSIDIESNRTIVKVVDTATNKVLRQMPNEEAIALSKTLGKLQGLMIKQMA